MRFDSPLPAASGLIDFDAKIAPANELEMTDPIAAAYQQGQTIAREEAAAELLATVQRLRQDADETLAAARAAWIAEQADHLSERLKTGLAAIEMRLSDHLAVVLKPFVALEMRERMIASFAEAFGSLVSGFEKHGGPSPALTIHGPADLVAALQARFDGSGIYVTWIECSQTDLSVTLGDTTLLSHCAAWLEGLTPEAGGACL